MKNYESVEIPRWVIENDESIEDYVNTLNSGQLKAFEGLLYHNTRRRYLEKIQPMLVEYNNRRNYSTSRRVESSDVLAHLLNSYALDIVLEIQENVHGVPYRRMYDESLKYIQRVLRGDAKLPNINIHDFFNDLKKDYT